MCDGTLSLGFAVTTAHESTIKEWFEESFGREPTTADWVQINADIERVEKNALTFLHKKLGGNEKGYGTIRDEGHSDDALVGSCWVDWSCAEGLEYVHGYYEEWHPRCNDTETDEALLEGTSEFSGCINAEIEFFNIEPADMERVEALMGTRPVVDG